MISLGEKSLQHRPENDAQKSKKKQRENEAKFDHEDPGKSIFRKSKNAADSKTHPKDEDGWAGEFTRFTQFQGDQNPSAGRWLPRESNSSQKFR